MEDAIIFYDVRGENPRLGLDLTNQRECRIIYISGRSLDEEERNEDISSGEE